jgi:cation:H+ antiporter
MMLLMLNCALILVGLTGLTYSADKFVDGASDLALNLNISKIVVAIVVIGLATSAPEMIVSATSALAGKSQLALGNAIGSNIANISFIIGLTALLMAIRVSRALIKKEFLLMIGTTCIGAFLISDGHLSRFDGIILLFTFIFVIYFLINNAKNTPAKESNIVHEDDRTTMTLKKSIIVTSIGIIALIGFSQLLVHGAVEVALYFGVSELIIGLTIIAIGTSLPELAASLAAIKKNSPDLAIGNIIGSNIFNIVGVLSIAALIQPFDVDPSVLKRDLPLLLVLTFGFLLVSVSYKPKEDGQIKKIEGFFFLTIFVSYIIILIGESLGWFSLDFLY